MALISGTRLGPYEILAPIGAGGMGEVYQANDTRLDRTVAIKVLPEHLADSPERKARFEREAKAISQLNHPHICTLYDVGEQDGIDFIVMEYIEGETLAERLKKGALPLDKALEYGIQIADGLDTAHRAGIVHRDLKPANVILTRSGTKILDFGLAKPYGESVETESSTRGRSLTAEGAVVGTLSYMSPEQLRGEAVDTRTDIFAYGAVLHEMVSGRPAFTRPTQAETITAILSEDPRPLSELRPEVPAALERLVATCLRKKPDERWTSPHDVALQLQEPLEHDAGASSKSPTRSTFSKSASLLSLGVLVAVATSWLGFRNDRTYLDRTTLSLPPGSELVAGELRIPLAVSPTGTHVAFLAASRDGSSRQLFIHALNEFDPRPIPGTQEAAPPVFFSPDGEWIGFHASSTLLKVNLSGGSPIKICDAGFIVLGASWGDDDTIVVGGLASGLMTVSANGGELKPLTQPEAGERFHAHPQFVPGRRAIVFDVASGTGTSIAAYSLETDVKKILFQGTRPQHGSAESLLYALDGRVMAVDFDFTGLEPVGRPIAIIEGVSGSSNVGHYAVSSSGSLVYAPLDERVNDGRLTWVDRRGTAAPVGTEQRAYSWPRISPDGTQVAGAVGDTGRREIWVQDLARGTRVRLTDEGDAVMPAWSPDGSMVAYGLNLSGRYHLYTAKADGSGDVRSVVEDEVSSLPFSWSANGDIAFHKIDPINKRDMWVWTSDGEEAPIVATPANEANPVFSPDGRWIAYVSDVSGQNEVYVVDYPNHERREVVSNDGGTEPLWSRDGRELFYRRADDMMVAEIDTDSGFTATAPRRLFFGRFGRDVGGVDIGATNYDISPNNERFLMVAAVAPPDRLHVLVDWTEERRKRVSNGIAR